MRKKLFVVAIVLLLNTMSVPIAKANVLWAFHDVEGKHLFGYTGVESAVEYESEVAQNGIRTNITTLSSSYLDLLGPSINFHNGFGVKVGIFLDTILFDDQFGWYLRPDYRYLFNTWYSRNSAYITPSKVAVLIINSEANNRHIPAASLDEATAYVKSKIANIPTIVGYGLTPGAVDISNQNLPVQPDGFAFWSYGVRHPEDPGSRFQYWLNYFKTHIDTSRQRLMIVFDASYGPPQIGAGLTQDMLGPMAVSYANLVKSDPLIVGMVGFTWASFGDTLGLRSITQSVRAYNSTASCILLCP
jgi:hypothetical protein